MKKKEKISVEGLKSGLNTAFVGLNLTNLPEGPTTNANETQNPIQEKPKKRGRLILRKEKSQRGGKTVIVIYDIPNTVHNRELEEMGRDLRKQCGCGGTIRDRTIEIQGDQPERIRNILEAKGFTVAGI